MHAGDGALMAEFWAGPGVEVGRGGGYRSADKDGSLVLPRHLPARGLGHYALNY